MKKQRVPVTTKVDYGNITFFSKKVSVRSIRARVGGPGTQPTCLYHGEYNMSFKEAVLNTQVETTTTNGMKAFESTLSKNVDMFFKIGASRGHDITPMFEAAYQENPDRALRIVQWARDVRGGAGERDLFRQILKYMEVQHKSGLLNTRLMQNVAEIGRWDDLLVFSDIDVKEKAYSLIKIALESGTEAKRLLDLIDTMTEEQCQQILDTKYT
jgi:Domain of unknown function (DUF2828)